MGHRRQRSSDDLTDGAFDDVADLVSAAANAMRERADGSAAAQRRAEKEQRRLAWEARQRRNFLGTGAGLLAGGLAASMGLITVAAVGIGLLTGGAVAYGLKAWEERPVRPRLARPARAQPLPEPTVAGDDARSALIRSVVTQALAHLRTVEAKARTIQDLESAAILTRIAAIGGRICTSVAEQPAGFDAAQRTLTYHAEKAALLATMATAHAGGADGERLANVRRVLARMERLFEETEAALRAEDKREMDLDLKLIDQALDEDLDSKRP
jgi:5-bromo-4-chloroindolyl phosphate hydrolysis protein